MAQLIGRLEATVKFMDCFYTIGVSSVASEEKQHICNLICD